MQCLDIYRDDQRFIKIQGGPAFLKRVRVEQIENRLHLLTTDDELVAVLEQL